MPNPRARCSAACGKKNRSRSLRGRGARLQRRARPALSRPAAAPWPLALPWFAPHLHPSPDTDDFASFRGVADGLALRLTESDAALHERLRPEEPVERMLFEMLEQFRVEAMAPEVMAGHAAQPAAPARAVVARLSSLGPDRHRARPAALRRGADLPRPRQRPAGGGRNRRHARSHALRARTADRPRAGRFAPAIAPTRPPTQCTPVPSRAPSPRCCTRPMKTAATPRATRMWTTSAVCSASWPTWTRRSSSASPPPSRAAARCSTTQVAHTASSPTPTTANTTPPRSRAGKCSPTTARSSTAASPRRA